MSIGPPAGAVDARPPQRESLPRLKTATWIRPTLEGMEWMRSKGKLGRAWGLRTE
jgi:hypothetical protein